MGDAGSFRRALDKARQKHRPSWLYHFAVPLLVLFGLGVSIALGQGKLDQLFTMIFVVSAIVWAMYDDDIFRVQVGLLAGLDAIEETIDGLQSEIVCLKSEVADLRANADGD